jgi:type I restriction enzyme S subunit
MITAVDCCVIRIDEKLHNRLYWVYLFNSDFMKRKMEALASGTTRKRISRSNLETMQVVCHDKKDQDRIIHGLTNLTKNIDAISEDVNLQKQIQKQIINQIFG